MSKCVLCGAELEAVLVSDGNLTHCVGYQCLNCKLQWTVAEHKDNQHWAVRHIRDLEAEQTKLTIDFQLEFNKINEFMGCLNDKLSELQSRIKYLEDSRTN